MIKFDEKIYELISYETLSDIGSEGYLFKHKKSGARIAMISNDDENKVFCVGFRTPPANSTGVPHILEHSVLCGSRKYPAKDPFIELAKGSLNTYLNAMTYPDKTIYPIASYNDVDFKNLSDVYLDAVFYPNIYTRQQIFKQEGWHFELESPESELIYNGVVYNEMKGAFSSASGKLDRICRKSLYPDTAYATESGGDPEFIPDLSYEEFLGFHKKLYHPSNSYIYIYGNCDIAERLEYLDKEFLSAFDKIDIDSEIELQKSFDKPVRVCEEYSVTEEEGTENKTYLAYNTSIGNSVDSKLALSMAVLEYVLFTAPGAPVKQALIDAQIGEDVSGDYTRSLKQPMISIVASNTEAEKEEEFVKIIKDVCAKLVSEGIDKNALRAGINYNEFAYREADFGRWPKGLLYGIYAFDSWLYDESKPFIHINCGEDYEFLKKMVDTDYYEKLVKDYILDNKHSSVVVLSPKVGLTAEMDEKTKAKLADIKAKLSKDELDKLVEDTKALKAYQSEPSTKEELLKIPMLSKEDISREVLPFYNEEKSINGVTSVHHNINTNKIVYLNLRFDLKNIADDMLPYANLLSKVLGYVGTEKHSYSELSNLIDINTGGIGFSTDLIQKFDENAYSVSFNIKGKSLYGDVDKMIELISEMVNTTVYNDAKRIKEIIGEVKMSIQNRMESAGNSFGAAELGSQMSETGAVRRVMSGYGFYKLLDDAYKNYDDKKAEVINKLEAVSKEVFCKDNLIISVTADSEGYDITDAALGNFLNGLSVSGKEPVKRNISFDKKKIAYKSAGQVVYVVRGGDYTKAGLTYNGAFRILETIMGYEYLWNNVRVKGGAYGCGASFGTVGVGRSLFYSYRDPNLRKTNEIYEKTPEYVKNFTADEREMTKYIIGTISDMDIPKTPSGKGQRSFDAYISHLTMDMLLKQRMEVLDATQDDIRALAPHIEEVLSQDYFCVVGSEEKINEEKDMFDVIENLI